MLSVSVCQPRVGAVWLSLTHWQESGTETERQKPKLTLLTQKPSCDRQTDRQCCSAAVGLSVQCRILLFYPGWVPLSPHSPQHHADPGKVTLDCSQALLQAGGTPSTTNYWGKDHCYFSLSLSSSAHLGLFKKIKSPKPYVFNVPVTHPYKHLFRRAIWSNETQPNSQPAWKLNSEFSTAAWSKIKFAASDFSRGAAVYICSLLELSIPRKKPPPGRGHRADRAGRPDRGFVCHGNTFFFEREPKLWNKGGT